MKCIAEPGMRLLVRADKREKLVPLAGIRKIEATGRASAELEFDRDQFVLGFLHSMRIAARRGRFVLVLPDESTRKFEAIVKAVSKRATSIFAQVEVIEEAPDATVAPRYWTFRAG